MEKGQLLNFDIYGNLISGKFIESEGDIITIEVISDSLGICQPGVTAELHKDFLIRKDMKVNIRLTSINIEKDVYFSSVTSISGRVVSIVGTKETAPHIAFKPLKGDNLIIQVNPSQEKQLKVHYKESLLRLRVKIKVDADSNDNKKTELIDFNIVDGPNFLDTIANIKSELGDIFININDSAKLLKELR